MMDKDKAIVYVVYF